MRPYGLTTLQYTTLSVLNRHGAPLSNAQLARRAYMTPQAMSEVIDALETKGLPRQQAETVARGLAANPNVFLRTKVEKELGLSADAGGAALGDAVVVGATYLGAAIVPLWPYFFFSSLNLALAISLACTLLALFAVGVAKGRVARLSIRRSGLQVMIVGSLSAGVGFAIGHLVTTLSG
ncbi:MAG: VIT1/CCC1 transporter family protein [Solirubrobacteraceae bacterium]